NSLSDFLQKSPQALWRSASTASVWVCGDCYVFERESTSSQARRTLVKSIRRRVKEELARASFDAALHRCIRRNTRGYLYAFRARTTISVCSVMCRLFVDRRQCQGRFWSDFNGNLDRNCPGSNWH